MTEASERAHGVTHGLVLPEAPKDLTGKVKAWREPVSICTYEPGPPNSNPMFLERRVYQGSSGKVYPLPCIDRIALSPTDRLWDAIHTENEYVRLMILPEIGGRLHIGYDKTNGYDFFYRQNVIKPALVGLAGPWISGGVEFNWPQHHRPATFMRVETHIDEGSDGEITIWCSDHDPMLRMKGMHGICLRPGSCVVELKVRLYNRTPLTQTFLWWANAATRVHEAYQSFFPEDIGFVADHAKRAVTSFPLSDRPYYGVDYPGRAKSGVPADELPASFSADGSVAPNDLSWYSNIPVPTSYMVAGTSMDFFGGYDHRANAGVVHVADHHIAPGKKQWTWGNHEFGYAWDRNLTDADGPYIELMAGVYTDNQPDFSYLAPWETKTFTQCWYPIREIGIPQMANERAAIHIAVGSEIVSLSIAVTQDVPSARVQLTERGEVLQSWTTSLRVAEVFTQSVNLASELTIRDFAVTIYDGADVLLHYNPSSIRPAPSPQVAQEPLAPEQIESVEELYLTGVHLSQYRHATRRPELYWREALRRDPNESRCLNAMGLWHLRRGELADSVGCFARAITRLTRLNPNPGDGEPFYNLGIALRLQDKIDEAYDAFFKSTWNAAWRAPAYFALAEIDCTRREWKKAEDHLHRSLRADADQLNARNLLAYVYVQTGCNEKADLLIQETLAMDPLDAGILASCGKAPSDGQVLLDLAFDLVRAGRRQEAIELLREAELSALGSSATMVLLTLADLEARDSTSKEAETINRLETVSHRLCLPNRIEEMLVLECTISRHPDLPLAHYLLGNLLYDRERHVEAIDAWEKAIALDPAHPTTWRNLGIGYFNIRHDILAAVDAYDHAFACDMTDARVLYERDQLWIRVGRSPRERLSELLKHSHLVELRDDLSVELATLYNQLDRPDDALKLMLSRRFQPWEGGEGLALAQFARAELRLGSHALKAKNPKLALEHFLRALESPENLGEARHLLAYQSDVFFLIATAYTDLGEEQRAKEHYLKAARLKGDLQQKNVDRVSEMSFWSALALQQLGMEQESLLLLSKLEEYARHHENAVPKIDYFATSLPEMLLFEEDLEKKNQIDALFFKAQAHLALGRFEESGLLLKEILEQDPNHAGAHDLIALREVLPIKKVRN